MLPFTRETPDRLWLGFVNEAESQTASVLSTRVLPVLAVACVAALVLSGGKQSTHPHAPPPSSAAAARMQVAAAGVHELPEPAPEETPDKVEAATPPQPPPPAEATPAPAAVAPEPDLSAPVVATPAPRPKVVRPPKPLSPAAARRAARAARTLRGALSQGRVQSSRENFAVPAADGDELGWTDAKTACSGLQVDGLGGWSLPSRAQAREIHRGKASPRSAYWTRQRGPHDDTIYVYDPRTRRSSPWLDQEIASVVCVQPRPR
ncbi:MAG: hypothetical protein ACRBN8_27140 [Nannocystales bacterium]